MAVDDESKIALDFQQLRKFFEAMQGWFAKPDFADLATRPSPEDIGQSMAAIQAFLLKWSQMTGTPLSALVPRLCPPPTTVTEVSTQTDAPSPPSSKASKTSTPNPKPATHGPHEATKSYAAAVGRGPKPKAEVVAALGKAFPLASAAQVINMATKITPASKAHIRHAPRGAAKVLHVTFAAGRAPLASQLPLDGPLFEDATRHLSPALREASTDTSAPLTLVSVSWNQGRSFRLAFSRPPPVTLDPLLQQYFSKYASDRLPASICISRFRFSNRVAFRRIPHVSPTGETATTVSLIQELVQQPLWSSVTLTKDPQFYRKSGDTFGIFFAEFADNATDHTLRAVLKQPVYLNGEYCRPVKAFDSKPPVPFCGCCQGWGHRALSCRSPTKNCPRCGLSHDERQHDRHCPSCVASPVATGVCSHAPKCHNCGGPHRADSRECAFFIHRRDSEWIRKHAPSRRSPPKSREKGAPAPSQVNRPTRPRVEDYLAGASSEDRGVFDSPFDGPPPVKKAKSSKKK